MATEGGAGDPEELARLLAGAGRGERAAFRALYDRTAPKLLGVVLRIIRDRAVAEDVVQDAYLRIWQNAASYAPEAGQPMTWMASIARNRAIDVARRRREVLVGPTEDGEDWFALLADPRDREGDFLDADGLRRCLARVEEEQRRCIVLAYMEGWSREELAERFGRNVNTIKTWLHRGLASLRACLGAP